MSKVFLGGRQNTTIAPSHHRLNHNWSRGGDVFPTEQTKQNSGALGILTSKDVDVQERNWLNSCISASGSLCRDVPWLTRLHWACGTVGNNFHSRSEASKAVVMICRLPSGSAGCGEQGSGNGGFWESCWSWIRCLHVPWSSSRLRAGVKGCPPLFFLFRLGGEGLSCWSLSSD